jgi:diguanylate cyclase (GGDEF)-like protein/PAS domain S-box-containing protein
MTGERLAAARVAALFNVARPAYYASIALGGLLLLVLWEALPAPILLAWFGLLVAVTLVRIGFHRAYLRPAPGSAARWEMRFALGAFAAGALWTFPAAVFVPETDPLLQMAVVFVVGGSVIGSAGVYAPSPVAFYAFSTLPLLAVTAQLALQPGRSYQLLALMVLVFGAVMVRVYQDIHGSILRTLRMQLENEDLVEQLAIGDAQQRDAIESFPEGIAVFDAADRIVVCNRFYAQLYGAGKAPGELVGLSYRDIARNAYEVEVIPPQYQAPLEEWLEGRLARRRATEGVAIQYQLRDGRWMQGRWVRSRGGGIVSSVTDVTELRRAQDAYGEQVAERHMLMDVLPVGVAYVADRVIVRCNRRLEQMLGYEPGELDGKPARVLYPDEATWRAAGEGYGRLHATPVLEGELPLATKAGGRLRCRLSTRRSGDAQPHDPTIVAFSDISEKHEADKAVRRSEAMYRNLVETSNDLIWSMDARGRWTYLNPEAVRRIYGCEPADMLGREFHEVLAPELSARDLAVFRRILAGESVFDYQTRHLRRDGVYVDLAFNAVPLRDAAGAVIGATGTAHDVTREKQAAAALHEIVEKLRLAVDAADLLYWEWDRDTGQLSWGRDPSALVGAEGGGRTMRWDDYVQMVHADDRERYLGVVNAAWERPDACGQEYRVLRQDGRIAWLASHGKSFADASGRVRRMIGVTQDITERKRQEEEARFLAYHDTLTGLPNRRLLDDRLRQAVFLAQRRDARVAVMVMDLDNFKQVNDQLGHRAGDAVLREAAHRLAGCVRKADTLARHGGDEFVVVIPDLQIDADCQVVAEKILRSLQEPFRVDGREFRIGASIGISLYPTDGGDGEAVLRNADAAMYRAKQLGRNNYRFYGR